MVRNMCLSSAFALALSVLAFFQPGHSIAADTLSEEKRSSEAEQLGIRLAQKCQNVLGAADGSAVTGETACFNGELNKDSVRKFLSHDLSGIRYLVIRSGGGDVMAAMDMADALSVNGFTIIIPGMCVSSCGNYLFVAAERKIVLDGGGVCWHGGPDSIKVTSDMSEAQIESLNKSIKRSKEFLQRFAVRYELISKLPDDWDQSIIPETAYTSFWCYNDAKFLETEFNVKGILFMSTKLPN
jgi:hypothetical protein